MYMIIVIILLYSINVRYMAIINYNMYYSKQFGLVGRHQDATDTFPHLRPLAEFGTFIAFYAA